MQSVGYRSSRKEGAVEYVENKDQHSWELFFQIYATIADKIEQGEETAD